MVVKGIENGYTVPQVEIRGELSPVIGKQLEIRGEVRARPDVHARIQMRTRRGARAHPNPSGRTGKRERETQNNRGCLGQGPPRREVPQAALNINKNRAT